MKPSKRQIKKEEKQLRTAKIIRSSPSNQRVAEFLVKQCGKDAVKIAAGMESAATAKLMKRRLGKLKVAVVSASESAEESVA